MERKKYKLAISDIKILINMPENLEFPSVGFCFEDNFEDGKEDVRYDVRYDDHIENPFGELLQNIRGCQLYRHNHHYTYIYSFQTCGNREKVRLDLSSDQTDNVLSIPQKNAQNCIEYLFAILGIELILLKYHRIFMHGALVRYKEEGLIFTGPSGIGKSTQARLWEQYENAEILNGDRVIMQADEKIIGHGSPYAGSSGIYLKKQVPIKAIIMLRQAKYNHIERLMGAEAFRTLFPRFLILPLDEYTDYLYGMIEKVVMEIPIYLLSCRPDQDAVDLVKETVFG